jgi:hypothetical protein
MHELKRIATRCCVYHVSCPSPTGCVSCVSYLVPWLCVMCILPCSLVVSCVSYLVPWLYHVYLILFPGCVSCVSYLVPAEDDESIQSKVGVKYRAGVGGWALEGR